MRRIADEGKAVLVSPAAAREIADQMNREHERICAHNSSAFCQNKILELIALNKYRSQNDPCAWLIDMRGIELSRPHKARELLLVALKYRKPDLAERKDAT